MSFYFYFYVVVFINLAFYNNATPVPFSLIILRVFMICYIYLNNVRFGLVKCLLLYVHRDVVTLYLRVYKHIEMSKDHLSNVRYPIYDKAPMCDGVQDLAQNEKQTDMSFCSILRADCS
ncbi:hypothetical protein L1887_16933 [Cichorium endivia]|nr:hypothetical protein L1887_16933 [Cichorium endivia]